MTENNYTHKDIIDVQRLLLKKATSISEANDVGNKIYRLKNIMLKWQQEAAKAEKQLLAITIKNNKIDFINKNDKKD